MELQACLWIEAPARQHGGVDPESRLETHPHNQPTLKRIDQTLFDGVAAKALRLPRLRINHNLHAEPELVQRFLNVLQPGTYVRPHRHLRATAGEGFECFLVLQGTIGLLLFHGDGTLRQWERLDAAGPLRGIELAEGQFHSLVALTPDAVMFEVKQGPYVPSADKDFLANFPAEGTPEAVAQEVSWREIFSRSGVCSHPGSPGNPG